MIWERLEKLVRRTYVPGGWLYEIKHNEAAYSVAFVPDTAPFFTATDVDQMLQEAVTRERAAVKELACSVVTKVFKAATQADIMGRPISLRLSDIIEAINKETLP
jgi:hypothetical protein